ncbi:unnamed protein product [Prunus brigantina]
MSQSEVPHIILNSHMVGGRRAKMRSEVVRIEIIQVLMPLTQSNHLLRAQVLYVTKVVIRQAEHSHALAGTGGISSHLALFFILEEETVGFLSSGQRRHDQYVALSACI